MKNNDYFDYFPPPGSLWFWNNSHGMMSSIAPTARSETGEPIREPSISSMATLFVTETKKAGRVGNKHSLPITRVINALGEVMWVETTWFESDTNPNGYYHRIA